MKLTAFEANGRLFHFKRIPFGLTNAVGAFQRVITQIIDDDGLKNIYPYLDDVTIAGDSMEELNEHSQRFEEALKKRSMTLNENKTVRGVARINILGYEIEKGRIAPDKNRLQPLLDMVAPRTLKELKQVRGLFAYYAKWIADFSTKIKPLTETEVFPLSTKARAAFELLKKDLGNVTLMSIDETQDFTVETDASNVAISATLNQNGKPVAFFSKTLNASQNCSLRLKKRQCQ